MLGRPRIGVAQTPKELERVFCFRYRIYVEEMRRKQRYADHAHRRIEDPLDADGINFAAFCADEVVGVCRVNLARDSDLGYYSAFYLMDSVGSDHPGATSITTRLMIGPEYRTKGLAVRLALASYKYVVPRGIRWNFIDCNDHLVRFFMGLGYVAHVPKSEHEEYGLVTRMRLEIHGLQHLERLRSPFAAALLSMRSAEPLEIEAAVA